MREMVQTLEDMRGLAVHHFARLKLAVKCKELVSA